MSPEAQEPKSGVPQGLEEQAARMAEQAGARDEAAPQ